MKRFMSRSRAKSRPPSAGRGKELEVTIAGLGGKGDGLAESPLGRLYVPFAAPGDRLLVRVGDAMGDGHAAAIAEIVAAGPGRIEPACDHFGACGGCLLQHIAPPPYLEWKRAQVVAALERRGLDGNTVGAIVPSAPGDRRRADFRARRTGHGVVIGFHQQGSHRIEDLQACPVVTPRLEALLTPLRRVLAGVLPIGAAASLPVLECDNGIAMVIETDADFDLAAREAMAAFAAEHDLASLAIRQSDGFVDPVCERRRPVLHFGGVAVTPPPGAFVQAGRQAEAALVSLAVAGVGEARRVADLFAGCGTFTLPLAATAKVRAVDGDAAQIGALREAVNGAAGRLDVTAEVRDLFRQPLSVAELAAFDAVVFDPPRGGARDQAAAIAGSAVPTVVAVSCFPATFARDARLLVDGGYVLERVTPVDQFLWSPHVELVAVFRRN